jgi:nucleoside-diphosphate-sugar epimerase
MAKLSPGTSIDIGTGIATSVLGVVEQIYELVGRGGKPLPGALPDRPGEIPSQVANTAAATTLLAWRASVTLAQGLRRLRDAACQ